MRSFNKFVLNHPTESMLLTIVIILIVARCAVDLKNEIENDAKKKILIARPHDLGPDKK